MTAPEVVLEGGARCLLAHGRARPPALVPLACWYDGETLWALGAPGWPPAGGQGAVHVRCGGGAVVATGHIRVLSISDPLALAVHAPAIAGALAGLALHDPSALLGAAGAAVLPPQRRGLRELAVLRVRLSGVAAVPDGQPPPGIAPALPPAVPADVRRTLAGVRRVVVARGGEGAGGPVEFVPGWWDQRFALVRAADGRPLAGDEPVAVAVDVEGEPGARVEAGLILSGRLRGGVLEAERATYWRGYGVETVDLPPAPSDLVMPD